MSTLHAEIRPVTYPDVPAIAALAREIWQATYPGIITQAQIDFMLEQRYGVERLYNDLEEADKWLDQAFVDGRRVAFAFSEIGEGEFRLDKLYVHPDVQRCAIGGQLIDHVARRAAGLGYPVLSLRVNKRNAHAIGFYEKHGFVTLGDAREQLGGGFVTEDSPMEKKL